MSPVAAHRHLLLLLLLVLLLLLLLLLLQFEYMMGKAVKWGMAVYEQDWLVTTYEQLNVTQSNVTAAREPWQAVGQTYCEAA